MEEQLRSLIKSIVEEIQLDEARKKWVIRKGKKKKKTICKHPGQKAKAGKCVTASASERAKRKRGAKRGGLKRKGKLGRLLKKRLKSLKKRKTFGLK